jgi:hypothetical protein
MGKVPHATFTLGVLCGIVVHIRSVSQFLRITCTYYDFADSEAFNPSFFKTIGERRLAPEIVPAAASQARLSAQHLSPDVASGEFKP